MLGSRIKAISLILSLMLLVSACAGTTVPATATPAAEPAAAPETMPEAVAYTPGTYTAVSTGHNGEMTVETKFSENEIVSVKVLESAETAHIFRAAAERIPAAIVQGQTLNVDTVSGATISRAAILSAVADCVRQAGGNDESLRNKELAPVTKNADQTLETQVLVVGSGIAGLSAAIEAAGNGAKVLLLEKLAVIGGSSSISGGKLQASESFVMKADGIEDTKEAFAKYLMDCARDLADPEMIEAIAYNSADNVQWLSDLGVQFMPDLVALHPYRTPWRGHLPVEQKGYGYTTPMEEKARALGVEILTETPAKSLIMEDGKVVGVNAQDKTGAAVAIKAGAVILATGGFDRSPELMELYSPLIKDHTSSGVVGNTGDGLIMARDAGAEIIARSGAIGNCLDTTFTYMTNTNGGSYQAASTGLFVAGEGRRFVDENNFSFARTAAMLDNGYTCFYSIFDQKSYVDALERAISMQRAFKADSMEELAGMTGMNPAVLSETVTRYNELCAAGEDKDFHKPAQFLTPVDQGPYYALLHTYVVSGTFGGPRINMDGQVINTAGEPIPGLYAAGEVANGQFLCYEYPGSGSALISYLTFGRLAGAAAAKTAIG